jgi:hypothetical protein
MMMLLGCLLFLATGASAATSCINRCTVVSGFAGLDGVIDQVLLQETLPSRAPPAVARTGVWTRRALNNIASPLPLPPWITFNADYARFTLAGGTYFIETTAPLALSSLTANQCRLVNITSGSVLAVGVGSNAPLGTLQAQFTFTDSALPVRLEHWVAADNVPMGDTVSIPGSSEVWSLVRIVKLNTIARQQYGLPPDTIASQPAMSIGCATSLTATAANSAAVVPWSYTAVPSSWWRLETSRTWTVSASTTTATTITLCVQTASTATTATGVYVWLRVNAVDVPRSTNAIIAPAVDSKQTCATIALTLQLGDTVEVAWSTSSTSSTPTATAVAAPRPLLPSMVWSASRLASDTPVVWLTDSTVQALTVAAGQAQTINFGDSAASAWIAPASGVYVVYLTCSPRLQANGQATVGVWLRVNGNAVANAVAVTTFGQINEYKALMRVVLLALNTGDAVSHAWTSTSASTVLQSTAATVGVKPSQASASCVAASLTRSAAYIQSVATTALASATNADVQLLSFTADDFLFGWSRSSATRMTCSVAGVYRVTLQAQSSMTGGTTATTVTLWLRVNGASVDGSASANLINTANTEIEYHARELLVTLNAGDFVEVPWSAVTSGASTVRSGGRLAPVAAAGARPLAPAARFVAYWTSGLEN